MLQTLFYFFGIWFFLATLDLINLKTFLILLIYVISHSFYQTIKYYLKISKNKNVVTNSVRDTVAKAVAKASTNQEYIDKFYDQNYKKYEK